MAMRISAPSAVDHTDSADVIIVAHMTDSGDPTDQSVIRTSAIIEINR
jgi:hypothetical protein